MTPHGFITSKSPIRAARILHRINTRVSVNESERRESQEHFLAFLQIHQHSFAASDLKGTYYTETTFCMFLFFHLGLKHLG